MVFAVAAGGVHPHSPCSRGLEHHHISGPGRERERRTVEPEDTEAPELEAEEVTILIESWRSDDQAIWDEQIIPAFEAEFPHISVEFTPTPPLEYPPALRTRLEGGIAGDLITCQPFDRARELYEDGHLAPLNDLDGIDSFGPSAQNAWLSADGSTPYCVPVASIIQGFYYNVDAFNELGLSVPETESELFDVLQAILDDGTYTPIGIGLSEWEAEHILFQNIGANYWRGEEGRLALIRGEDQVTDQEYVDTLATMARMDPYFHSGASGISYRLTARSCSRLVGPLSIPADPGRSPGSMRMPGSSSAPSGHRIPTVRTRATSSTTSTWRSV